MPSTTWNPVHGADWPAWQRDLGPFTYERDEDLIRRRMAQAEEGLQRARRSLAWALKQQVTDRGARHSVRLHRREIDRFTTHIRQGATRLRILQAKGLIPVAAADLDRAIRAMPTADLEHLIAAE